MDPPRWLEHLRPAHEQRMFLLALIYLVRVPYRSLRLRVRQWGRLPFRRGPTILIANHQQEDESEVVVLRALLQGPWNKPIFTAVTGTPTARALSPWPPTA